LSFTTTVKSTYPPSSGAPNLHDVLACSQLESKGPAPEPLLRHRRSPWFCATVVAHLRIGFRYCRELHLGERLNEAVTGYHLWVAVNNLSKSIPFSSIVSTEESDVLADEGDVPQAVVSLKVSGGVYQDYTSQQSRTFIVTGGEWARIGSPRSRSGEDAGRGRRRAPSTCRTGWCRGTSAATRGVPIMCFVA
jgi:hypothetical protein